MRHPAAAKRARAECPTQRERQRAHDLRHLTDDRSVSRRTMHDWPRRPRRARRMRPRHRGISGVHARTRQRSRLASGRLPRPTTWRQVVPVRGAMGRSRDGRRSATGRPRRDPRAGTSIRHTRHAREARASVEGPGPRGALASRLRYPSLDPGSQVSPQVKGGTGSVWVVEHPRLGSRAPWIALAALDATAAVAGVVVQVVAAHGTTTDAGARSPLASTSAASDAPSATSESRAPSPTAARVTPSATGVATASPTASAPGVATAPPPGSSRRASSQAAPSLVPGASSAPQPRSLGVDCKTRHLPGQGRRHGGTPTLCRHDGRPQWRRQARPRHREP